MIDALVRALQITPEQADIILQKIAKEMKKQEMLLSYSHQKHKLETEEILRIEEINLLCVRKKAQRKEGKVRFAIRMNFFAEIERLREKKLSWRQISAYIKKVHKTKIPYQSIQRVFEEIQKEIGNKK